MTARFNVSMEDTLLDRVDKFAENAHISRSTLLTVAVQQYMDAQEQMPSIQKQLDALKGLLYKLDITEAGKK